MGKGRLVKSLLYDYNRFFSKVVTHTTRKPRREEVNGTSYHFIQLDRYNELVSQENYFVEHARVHNNFYGVSFASWESVTNAGKIPILEIDIQGAKVIHSKAASLGITPKFLFVAPPSLAMLVTYCQNPSFCNCVYVYTVVLRIHYRRKGSFDAMQRAPRRFSCGCETRRSNWKKRIAVSSSTTSW